MNLHLTAVDWYIVIGILMVTFALGFSATRKAGKSLEEFFIGGRSMPWWLLGVSMVATTFDTNVPNMVTNIVRDHGISGNWCWLGMVPSGMLTVFLYAKLWRRSGAVTDLEFYEVRYSGPLASFLRGFRAVYLGLALNVMIMATTILAAVKIGGAMLGLTPVQSVLGALVITCLFSAAGGLQGVLFSDFLLFIVAMAGSIAAAVYSLRLPGIGGLSGMVEKLSAIPSESWKMDFFSFQTPADFVTMFLIPITVIWWSVWYAGAEPGGGGFMVQRMLAAKDEKHAVKATLLFQIAHYALRPWPWFIVALCSLLVYPDRAALLEAVGNALPAEQVQSDVAYPLMLTKMPPVWTGIIVASLVAAFISTISTMLNWGSSYLVHDFYARFIRKDASQRELVKMGRVFTVLLVTVAALLSFCLQSALDAFNILLSFGAGTGLVYMLRWFWWRINAASELTAMIAASVFALYFNVFHAKLFPQAVMSSNTALVCCVFATMVCWMTAVYVGAKTDKEVLYEFCRKINPAGPGWTAVRRQAAAENISLDNPDTPQQPLGFGVLAACCGGMVIYSILLGTGACLYARWGLFAAYVISAILFGALAGWLWRKMSA